MMVTSIVVSVVDAGNLLQTETKVRFQISYTDRDMHRGGGIQFLKDKAWFMVKIRIIFMCMAKTTFAVNKTIYGLISSRYHQHQFLQQSRG